METMQNFVLTLILAMACAILAYILRANKQGVLALAAELIQKAETAVQGSGMGSEKKALVLAQLEAAGVNATNWLSNQIDVIVAALNSRGAWLAEQAKEHTAGMEKAGGGGNANE